MPCPWFRFVTQLTAFVSRLRLLTYDAAVIRQRDTARQCSAAVMQPASSLARGAKTIYASRLFSGLDKISLTPMVNLVPLSRRCGRVSAIVYSPNYRHGHRVTRDLVGRARVE